MLEQLAGGGWMSTGHRIARLPAFRLFHSTTTSWALSTTYATKKFCAGLAKLQRTQMASLSLPLPHIVAASLTLGRTYSLFRSLSCFALASSLSLWSNRVLQLMNSERYYCRLFVAPVRFGARHQLIGRTSGSCSSSSSARSADKRLLWRKRQRRRQRRMCYVLFTVIWHKPLI